MDELEQGTTDAIEAADPGEAGGTEQVAEGDLTQADAQTAQPAEQSEFERLIPPNELPDELKGHWKRMHGAYTKLLQGHKDLAAKAAVVDQFYSNPDYARQVLVGWASQNGYQLTPLGQQVASQAAQPAQAGVQGVPPQLFEAVKANLPPELQWMAESQAKSLWAATQHMLAPIVQQTQQQQYTQRASEYDQLANELSEQAPGWEEHESAMDEFLQFMQSPAMKHPKFGSKLAILHRAVTGQAAAVSEATKRMNAAVRNRTGVGSNRAGVVPNLADRIRKASSNNDAWELAKQAALNGANLDD